MSYTRFEVIGGLLKGGSQLFGARVELTWPDGLPEDMTEDELRSIGEQWAPKGDRPEWVRADTEFCRVPVPCGKELLTDGGCERHGSTQAADPATLRVLHAGDGSACHSPVAFRSGQPRCTAHDRIVQQVPARDG